MSASKAIDGEPRRGAKGGGSKLRAAGVAEVGDNGNGSIAMAAEMAITRRGTTASTLTIPG